jgi:hypothetical protein
MDRRRTKIAMAKRPAPPTDVIAAFGGDPGDVVRLAGGQGGSWRSGPVVLKRAGPGSAAAWLGPVLRDVPDQPGFRLARPLVSREGAWTFQGGKRRTGWPAITSRDGGRMRWLCPRTSTAPLRRT